MTDPFVEIRLHIKCGGQKSWEERNEKGRNCSGNSTGGSDFGHRRSSKTRITERKYVRKGSPEMAIKFSPALMSEEDDLEQGRPQGSRVRRWIKLSVSPVAPIHRYAGILTIQGQSLVFRGTDLTERKDYQKTIHLYTISQISLGLDERVESSHKGSFVPGAPRPLVVRYRHNGNEQTVYFITNFPGFRRRVDGNIYWYETLWNYAVKAKIDHLRLVNSVVLDSYSIESSRQTCAKPLGAL